VQRNAMASWNGSGGLQTLASKDPFITQYLKKSEIAACFNPKYYLRHVDQIFNRVFRGGGQSQQKGTK
jgi:adenylosuccinate lyase